MENNQGILEALDKATLNGVLPPRLITIFGGDVETKQPALKFNVVYWPRDKAAQASLRHSNRRQDPEEQRQYQREVGQEILIGWEGMTHDNLAGASEQALCCPDILATLPNPVPFSPRDAVLLFGMLDQDLFDVLVNESRNKLMYSRDAALKKKSLVSSVSS